jgi:hypothetical protein
MKWTAEQEQKLKEKRMKTNFRAHIADQGTGKSRKAVAERVTSLDAWLEIQIPEGHHEFASGDHDFATEYRPIAQEAKHSMDAMLAERKRLDLKPGEAAPRTPAMIAQDRLEHEKECAFCTHMHNATFDRYVKAFGQLNHEGSDGPCLLGGSKWSCDHMHSLSGFKIALFAQTQHYNEWPYLKEKRPEGSCKFENVAVYSGVVLLVHGAPREAEIVGRYRLSKEATLVVAGIANHAVHPSWKFKDIRKLKGIASGA